MGLITQFTSLTTESTIELVADQAGLLFLIAKIFLLEGRRVADAFKL